jgi:hypothetical protein
MVNMMTLKQALLVMIKARLRDIKEQGTYFDHESFRQQGKIDAYEEIIDLIGGMKIED